MGNASLNGSVVLVLLILSGVGCHRAETPSESAPPPVAQKSHEPHPAPAAAPGRPEGALWPTDEPLRTAMSRIRAALERAAPAYERGEFQATEARALARAVEDDVAYMVANCKLEPQADAALHVLIGRMMSAATALKDNPASTAGVPQLEAALTDYSTSFDHPGWKHAEF